MDYEGLETGYWTQQAQRVESLRLTINERSQVRPGRVIPEGDDVVIGSGRRLNLAVLFLDISGFSARASFTDGEQATNLRVLSLFFSEMIKIAEDYGGVVEKNTGDGLLAYFEDNSPAPTPASQKAVAAALTMFAANEYLIGPIIRRSARRSDISHISRLWARCLESGSTSRCVRWARICIWMKRWSNSTRAGHAAIPDSRRPDIRIGRLRGEESLASDAEHPGISRIKIFDRALLMHRFGRPVIGRRRSPAFVGQHPRPPGSSAAGLRPLRHEVVHPHVVAILWARRMQDPTASHRRLRFGCFC